MNERGRQALIDAALKGVPQHFGAFSDGGDGLCALGVLAKACGWTGKDPETVDTDTWMRLEQEFELDQTFRTHRPLRCECGLGFNNESTLIAHLNDMHHLDFIGIANKCGTKEEIL